MLIINNKTIEVKIGLKSPFFTTLSLSIYLVLLTFNIFIYFRFFLVNVWVLGKVWVVVQNFQDLSNRLHS